LQDRPTRVSEPTTKENAMPLDPKAQALIDMLAAVGFDGIEHQPIETGRQLVGTVAAMGGEPPDVAEVREITVPGSAGDVSVRLYRPASDAPLPVFVWLHGGGWVYGTVDLDDTFCRIVANEVEAVVLSVEYRLAPEHPYPAGLDDAVAVVSWAQEHSAAVGGDPTRVAVGGESAGGNLAAATALRLRDSDAPPLSLQVLVCAMLDSAMSGASYQEHGEGKFLTSSLVAWAFDHYAKGHLEEPYVSPMHATDLTGSAPALILTAECDPLHDDGVAYRRRLLDAGVAAEWIDFDGMIHGFFSMATQFPQAHEAAEAVVQALTKAFA
jgi:acetyl esterase